ncbi:MAG: hypothetical protein QNJ72_09260 [Pleurocapsa sp. MO_226.B13]|nr:hypothetical protein [Pleurocapsa sp. MO_226.B13]
MPKTTEKKKTAASTPEETKEVSPETALEAPTEPPVKKEETVSDLTQTNSSTEIDSTQDEEDREKREEFDRLDREAKEAFATSNKAFESGMWSLKEIKDKKLFSVKYKTFGEYCEKEFPFTLRYANYQINFVSIKKLLEREHDVPILPTSEAQVRCLAGKPEAKIKEVWLKACKKVKDADAPPSRETVQAVLKNIEQSQALPSELPTGTWVMLRSASDDKHKQLVRSWGKIKVVHSKTYTVLFPEGEIKAVPKTAVQEIELTEAQKKEREEMLTKLGELYEHGTVEESQGITHVVVRYLEKKQDVSFSDADRAVLAALLEVYRK